MAYKDKIWKNGKAGGTPLNDVGLNDFEKRIKDEFDLVGVNFVKRGNFTGDANTIADNGVYSHANGTITNLPTNNGVLSNLGSSNLQHAYQMYTSHVGIVYTRVKWGANWGVWQELQAKVSKIEPLTLIGEWTVPTGNFEQRFAILKNGKVNLTGLVTGGATGSTICILPVGFRPRRAIRFPVAQSSTSCILQINVDGSVVHMGSGLTTNIFLDGIAFNVEW